MVPFPMMVCFLLFFLIQRKKEKKLTFDLWLWKLGTCFINTDEIDLMKATGNEEDDRQTSLQRVHQLTGFSDPLYAEAYVHVHRYDIVLGELLSSTLQPNKHFSF